MHPLQFTRVSQYYSRQCYDRSVILNAYHEQIGVPPPVSPLFFCCFSCALHLGISLEEYLACFIAISTIGQPGCLSLSSLIVQIHALYSCNCIHRHIIIGIIYSQNMIKLIFTNTFHHNKQTADSCHLHAHLSAGYLFINVTSLQSTCNYNLNHTCKYVVGTSNCTRLRLVQLQSLQHAYSYDKSQITL